MRVSDTNTKGARTSRGREMQTEFDRSVCAVALLSGEEQFVEEWIAYHRLIGIDHFIDVGRHTRIISDYSRRL